MDLLEVPRVKVDAAAGGRGRPFRESVSDAHGLERRSHELLQPSVLQMAGGGDHDALGLVEPVKEAADLLGAEVGDRFARA